MDGQPGDILFEFSWVDRLDDGVETKDDRRHLLAGAYFLNGPREDHDGMFGGSPNYGFRGIELISPLVAESLSKPGIETIMHCSRLVIDH